MYCILNHELDLKPRNEINTKNCELNQGLDLKPRTVSRKTELKPRTEIKIKKPRTVSKTKNCK